MSDVDKMRRFLAGDDSVLGSDGNAEEKMRAFLSEGKTQSQPKQEESMMQPFYDIGAGVSDVMLKTLGFPGSIANYISEKAGSERRFHGSDSFRDIYSSVGIGTKPGQEPDTGSYKAGEYLGTALEFLMPVLRYGKGSLDAVKAGKEVVENAGTVKGVAQKITAPFITSPKTATYGEIAGSIGAGYGAHYAGEEFGSYGELVGGIVGGLVPQTLPAVAPRLYDSMKKSFFSYTPIGQKIKASNRLKSLAETDDVLKNIDDAAKNVLPGAKLTPYQLSGDRHLLSLQKEILKKDPTLDHNLRILAEETNELARKELKEIGGNVPIEQTQAYYRGRVAHATELINAKIRKVTDDALDGVKGVTSTSEQRLSANQKVNAAIKKALAEERNREKDIWGTVKKGTYVKTNNTRDWVDDYILNRPATSDPDELPKYVADLVRGDGKKPPVIRDDASITDLHAFYSRLGDSLSKEKALEAPNWNKVRLLGELRDKVLDDMDSAGDTGIRNAIAFSRAFNEKFKGGALDTILGSKRTGAKTHPDVTLESSIGLGAKGAVEINRIIKAAPESKASIEEYLKSVIAQSSLVKDGRINATKAKEFMDKNREIFKIFPQLRSNMEKAIGLEERAVLAGVAGKARTARVKGSMQAKIANAKPGRVLSEILTSPNPKQTMARIYSRGSREGRDGLKNDVISYLKAKSGAEITDTGERILSGHKMLNAFNENREILSIPLGKDGVERLETVINTLIKNESRASLPEVGGRIIEPSGSKVIDYLIVTYFTRLGAMLGHGTSGASLRTAGKAATTAQNALNYLNVDGAEKLLTDSVTNPELFRALMSNVNKPAEAKRAMKILQGWMVSNAVDYGTSLFEENE